MSSGLGEVGEGSCAQSKLKIPIEKDNICELGELAKSAHGSALNGPAAPALQSSIAPSDAAWCACGRHVHDLLDLDAIGTGSIR